MSDVFTAVSLRFGKTIIYLYGVETDLGAKLHQESNNGTLDFIINATEAKKEQQLSIKLHRDLDRVLNVSTHPTVHLGCTQGLYALAEGLIVDDSGSVYRVISDFLVDLFFTPKVYRGKISLRCHSFELVIHETEKVPGTDQEFLILA